VISCFAGGKRAVLCWFVETDYDEIIWDLDPSTSFSTIVVITSGGASVPSGFLLLMIFLIIFFLITFFFAEVISCAISSTPSRESS
jgi:hypothetical protein